MVKKTRGRYNVVREVRNERVLEKYSADGMSRQIVHWCNDDDDDIDTFSWSSYWTNLNFSTDSDGATNVAALNTALTDKRYVKIVTPGVYDFDNTIWIPSDTTLEVCEGVTFRKETGSHHSHIIGNKGMLTNTRNDNIRVYGNGLTLDINGIDTYSLTDTDICPILRLRSVFQFFKVDNFIVDDIYGDNMDMDDQFFMNYHNCTFGEISNLDIAGAKDCCPTSGTDLNFTNCKFYSTDDAMFIGVGYPNATVSYCSSERITITNLEVGSPGAPAGNISRMWGGSWGDWSNGMTTHDQESVVASNGLVYARGWDSGGDLVSTVEPTHTDINEHPTLADGIEWWLMDTGGESLYSVSVKDVIFKNVNLTSDRTSFQFWHNYVTAGTEGTSVIEDIIVDNLTIPVNYTKYIFEQRAGRVGEVIIKNSTLNSWVDAVGTGLLHYPSSAYILSLDKFIVDNCDITISTANNKLIYMAVANAILGELEIKNSSVDLLAFFVETGAITTTTFGKLAITDSIIDANGGKPIIYGRGQLDGDNTIFTRVKFIDVERLVYLHIEAGAHTPTQRYIDCIFQTSLAYIVVNTTSNYIINIIMSGTTFIDPSGHLFYTNQGNGSISINISDSVNDVVTPAKVRNSTQTTIVACDIPYV